MVNFSRGVFFHRLIRTVNIPTVGYYHDLKLHIAIRTFPLFSFIPTISLNHFRLQIIHGELFSYNLSVPGVSFPNLVLPLINSYLNSLLHFFLINGLFVSDPFLSTGFHFFFSQIIISFHFSLEVLHLAPFKILYHLAIIHFTGGLYPALAKALNFFSKCFSVLCFIVSPILSCPDKGYNNISPMCLCPKYFSCNS